MREYLSLIEDEAIGSPGAKLGTKGSPTSLKNQIHLDNDNDKDKDRDKTPEELEMMALWEVKVDVELRRRAIQYQLKQFRRIMDGNMTSMFKIGTMMHPCSNIPLFIDRGIARHPTHPTQHKSS